MWQFSICICLWMLVGVAISCGEDEHHDEQTYNFQLLQDDATMCGANFGIVLLEIESSARMITTYVICDDDSWDDRSATMYCQARGFAGGSAVKGVLMSAPTGADFMSVHCDTTVYSLDQCNYEVDMCASMAPAVVNCAGHLDVINNYPSGNAGCGPNCDECGTDGWCHKCKDDMYHTATGECRACLQEGCRCEADESVCDSCRDEDGYGYVYDGSIKCEHCSTMIPHCVGPCEKDTLMDYQWCSECEENFKSDDGFFCTPENCPKYCNNCTADGECSPEHCAVGTGFNHHHNECDRCDWACERCEFSDAIMRMACTQCAPGHYISEYYDCWSCGVMNCMDCGAGGPCTMCRDGYEMVPGIVWHNEGPELGDACANQKCSYGCSHCEREGRCDEWGCVQGRYRLADDTCKLCSDDIEHCSSCEWQHDPDTDTAEIMCRECTKGRYFNPDTLKCEECSDNCLYCWPDYNGGSSCGQCISGFGEIWNENGSACVACNQNCMGCYDDGFGMYCWQCDDGYIFNQENYTCEYDTTLGKRSVDSVSIKEQQYQRHQQNARIRSQKDLEAKRNMAKAKSEKAKAHAMAQRANAQAMAQKAKAASQTQRHGH